MRLDESLGHGISSLSDKLDNISQLFSETSGIIYYRVNGKLEELSSSKLHIDDSNFRLYVGQTYDKGNSGIYGEDFYVGGILYLLEKCSNDSIINIEVCSSVSQTLNGLGEEDGAMNTSEQIEYINGIINKYFKKYKSRIRVTIINDRHPELFDKLSDSGVYSIDRHKIKDIDNLSSMDIAHLLYRGANDDRFFNRIASTSPTRVSCKAHKYSRDNPRNYYALIEISLRIHDYINGINIHGGEERQNRYDAIITDLLAGKYNHIEEIDILREYIRSKTNDDFKTLNISTKKYKEEKNRINKLKSVRNKLAKIIGWVSISAAITIGVSRCADNIEQRALEQKQEIIIKKALRNIDQITWQFKSTFEVYETEEEKYRQVMKLGERYVDIFLDIYGGGNFTRQELITFFISKMIDDENFPYVTDWAGDRKMVDYVTSIVEDSAIRALFSLNGYKTEGYYGKFAYLENNFRRTFLNTSEELVVPSKYVKPIGNFRTYEWGIYEELGIIECPIHSKEHTSIDCDFNNYRGLIVTKTNDGSYSLKGGKEIAEDFFTNGLVRKVSRTMDTIYYSITGDYIENHGKMISDKLSTLVATGEITNQQIEDMDVYDYLLFLKKYSGLNLEEILQNTLELDSKNKNRLLTDIDDKAIVIYLGERKDSKFNNYLFVITINGKKYFYLDHQNNPYHIDFSYNNPMDDLNKFSQGLLEVL